MRVLAVVLSSPSNSAWAEVVGAGRAAVQVADGALEVAVLGPEEEVAQEMAREAWRGGAERIWLATDPVLQDLSSDRYVAALTEVARAVQPTVLLLRADPMGAELGPRVAWRLQAASITDVVGVRRDPEGSLLWIRPMYGGKALAAVRSHRPVTVVTVRPRAFSAQPVRSGDPGPEGIRTVPLDEAVRIVPRIRVLEHRRQETTGPRLEEARVVVGGGRGIGGEEGFRVLEELARLMGGTVGASRAAVDAGWAPGHLQIGQTGKKIAPELYLAVGISGASQHLAGVSGARHIVAINTDPEAPIFKAAEVGVVEDWREIVPRLVERLKERKRADP
ncbi:MAG: electron transfer flavoprotein subunit alpha/FixB family protein [Armatimonadota bacterium]|nr:electron transfer flavoprotein subunit alpha/FixB family protein [Armatimonadota bacterium]MDR7444518.1 electron transfer flavoprotein subunit alpha/FixB family protein [Armatimonadota bacterium]MDR7570686.1 electron transfer flavoprotein subunit alpha/FixB family protein [Armatimonadota bacterium]MDR7615309.1 electron transfer flavoprotein subunit alpha/FixB family protein [Armatimonadota bacterium]